MSVDQGWCFRASCADHKAARSAHTTIRFVGAPEAELEYTETEWDRNAFRYSSVYTALMPRKPSKSYEEFIAGALALVAEGRTITFAAIREKLGGGSNELLQAYIKRYTLERQKDDAGGLPKHVTEDVHGWYAKLVMDAKERAEEQLSSRSKAVEGREQVSKAKEDDLQRREDRLAGKEEFIHARLADVEQQLATARGEAESKGTDLAEARGQLGRLQTQLTMEVDQRASQERLHVAERDQLRQLVLGAAERMASEVSTLRSKVMEAVDSVNQSWRGLRTDTGGKLDKLLAGGQTQREAMASVSISLSKIEAHGGLMADLSRAVDRLSMKQSEQGGTELSKGIARKGARAATPRPIMKTKAKKTLSRRKVPK